jgi:hypothetical protein
MAWPWMLLTQKKNVFCTGVVTLFQQGWKVFGRACQRRWAHDLCLWLAQVRVTLCTCMCIDMCVCVCACLHNLISVFDWRKYVIHCVHVCVCVCVCLHDLVRLVNGYELMILFFGQRKCVLCMRICLCVPAYIEYLVACVYIYIYIYIYYDR